MSHNDAQSAKSVVLTQHQAVLKIVSEGSYCNDEGAVRVMTFESVYDDSGKPIESYWMDYQDWTDMGEPERILVTVEIPGPTWSKS